MHPGYAVLAKFVREVVTNKRFLGERGLRAGWGQWAAGGSNGLISLPGTGPEAPCGWSWSSALLHIEGRPDRIATSADSNIPWA